MPAGQPRSASCGTRPPSSPSRNPEIAPVRLLAFTCAAGDLLSKDNGRQLIRHLFPEAAAVKQQITSLFAGGVFALTLGPSRNAPWRSELAEELRQPRACGHSSDSDC